MTTWTIYCGGLSILNEARGAEAPVPSLEPAVWDRLRSDLERAVARQCPAWLRDSAEDLVQAALIKVMELLRKSEGERDLSSFYLYRVAHSALVDEIRRHRRRREVALGGEGEEGAEGVDPAAPRHESPERAAASFQLGEAIQGCLVAMKQERRLAVVLYLQGHSVPEAAQILGWDAKRTENLVYRGLADLRQCLVGKGHRP